MTAITRSKCGWALVHNVKWEFAFAQAWSELLQSQSISPVLTFKCHHWVGWPYSGKFVPCCGFKSCVRWLAFRKCFETSGYLYKVLRWLLDILMGGSAFDWKQSGQFTAEAMSDFGHIWVGSSLSVTALLAAKNTRLPHSVCTVSSLFFVHLTYISDMADPVSQSKYT